MAKFLKTPDELAAACIEHGGLKAVCRATGMTYYAVRKLYLQAVDSGIMEPLSLGRKTREETKNTGFRYKPEPRAREPHVPVLGGRVKAVATPTLAPPPAGKINRYFFTCAQNNTKLHDPFWQNLHALCKHYAEQSHATGIHVSRFTYVKEGLGASGDKGRLTGRGGSDLYAGRNYSWDPRLEPYLSDGRLEVAPGLVWCGEMNVLPTAVNPLSGLEVYTGRKSGIFPHVKIAMRSVAADEEGDPTKFNYTTGTVTMRNYIQKKAGLKAEFHHCYGAILAEVDSEGNWWCRQINADSEGTIYDIDIKVEIVDGESVVTTGHRVRHITWGDPQVADIDQGACDLAFAPGGMKDALRPQEDSMGDVLDFRGRAWQEMRNPHVMFRRFVEGSDDLVQEINNVDHFLGCVERPWCVTYCSHGNHEEKLYKWLQEEDGRKDPVNAQFWLLMQSRVYEDIRRGRQLDNPLKAALEELDLDSAKMPNIRFLRDGEGHIICPDASGGIQVGIHTHKGPRGSRGTPSVWVKMGRKMNGQHTHSAGIWDGVYYPGTLQNLNPDWTTGHPSDWSWSNVVTYDNGKRAIYTFWAQQWAAGRGLPKS